MTDAEERIGGGAIDSAVEAAKQAREAAVSVEQLVDAIATFMKYSPTPDNEVSAPDVTVKEMKATLAVAKSHSFTIAAKELGVSQPGLSRQVQRVEHAYGIEIFDRSSKSTPITKQGQIILEAFQESVNMLARSMSAIKQLA